jgi:hypothetical protein
MTIVDLVIVSQNLQYGALKDSAGRPDDRWGDLREAILEAGPDVVLLQEAVGWRDFGSAQVARAERELKMRLHIASSGSGGHTVVGHRPDIPWTSHDDRYSRRTLHGFCQVLLDIGLDKPLSATSAHLDPYSADAAAQEAQLILSRSYRYGGIGLIGGDINHLPADPDTDPEPDWETVMPYNRSSRTIPSAPGEPVVGNRVVGKTFRQGALTDVAAYLARLGDGSGRCAPTGHGDIRVDQFHITPALVPALAEYDRLDKSGSDHHGIRMVLDTDLIDVSAGFEPI